MDKLLVHMRMKSERALAWERREMHALGQASRAMTVFECYLAESYYYQKMEDEKMEEVEEEEERMPEWINDLIVEPHRKTMYEWVLVERAARDLAVRKASEATLPEYNQQLFRAAYTSAVSLPAEEATPHIQEAKARLMKEQMKARRACARAHARLQTLRTLLENDHKHAARQLCSLLGEPRFGHPPPTIQTLQQRFVPPSESFIRSNDTTTMLVPFPVRVFRERTHEIAWTDDALAAAASTRLLHV